jgi:hypothetical protein
MKCALKDLLDDAGALVYKGSGCSLVDERLKFGDESVHAPEMHYAQQIWKGTAPEDLPRLAAQGTWGDEMDTIKNLLARGAELALQKGRT